MKTNFTQSNLLTFLLTVITVFTFTVAKAGNPMITLKGNDTVKQQINTTYYDLGATATDDNSNNITNFIQTDVSKVNVSVFGEYEVKYTVTDAYGNKGTAIRIVKVTDTIRPKIVSPEGGLIYACVGDMNFIEPQVTATDNYFPTVQVVRTGAYNLNVIGNYIITYTATDGEGNSVTFNRTVRVINCIKPEINFSPRHITIKEGETYDFMSGVSVQDINFASTDFLNPSNGCKIEIAWSTVDLNTPGEYEICYLAINGAGLLSDTTCREVTVESLTASLNDVFESKIKIYPNPNNGVFEIEAEVSPNTYIKITNIAGQIVKTISPEAFINGKTTITLNGVDAGIYFVQIQTGNGVSAQKFLITR